MVKKIFALILTVVLLGSFMVVPASAEELNDYKFFSVDYRTTAEFDLIGGLAPVLTVVPTIPTGEFDGDGNEIYKVPEKMSFVQDATLGVPVANFDGTYSVGYEADLSKLKKDFTVEVYFKLGPGQNGQPWSQVCGTVWMAAENKAAHGFSLNTSSMALAPSETYPGSADGDIPAQGPFIGTKKQYMLTWSTGIGKYCCINDSFAGGKKADKDAAYGQWCHVVYTFDGENEALYYNNTEIFNRRGFYADNEEGVVHDLSNDMSKLFRIAGYNWANNWDMVDMQCAYVNLYETAATKDEVATLFANKDVVSEVPDFTPAPVPTAEPGQPTAAPSDNGGSTTPAPTKAPTQNNTQTFDLGLVSLAAVALSSVVVTKKKRK